MHAIAEVPILFTPDQQMGLQGVVFAVSVSSGIKPEFPQQKNHTLQPLSGCE